MTGRERVLVPMNKTRGKLLALSAAGLLAALLLPVQVAALTLMGVCFLGALILLLWVGVPGVFSYLFFRKKWMV